MSLADQVLAVNDDLPIRTDKPVHSGKVRSVYWLTPADSARLIREKGYDVPADTPLALMVISDRISAFDCIWQGVDGLNGVPGKGAISIQTKAGPLAIVQLMGRTFMNASADCPFRTMDEWLKKHGAQYKLILVDMHAEATSEKVAMGKFLDGRVTAVLGTHTHIQTADEAISAKGTAYLTDLGMTGPCDSVIGRTTDAILTRFLTGMPTKFEIASGDVRLHGALLSVDPATGKALKIKRVEEILSKPA